MRMLSINQEQNSADQFGIYFTPELQVTNVPRGRTAGLFGALVGAVCNIDSGRALPVTAIDDLGSARRMFDYDPAQAISLDAAAG